MRNIVVACRRLRRSGRATAASVVIIALTLGCGIAGFAILNGVLLEPLPYPNAARLVAVVPVFGDYTQGPGGSSPILGFREALLRHLQSADYPFEMVATENVRQVVLTSSDVPERIGIAEVAGDYFLLLGARSMHGRLFDSGELMLPDGSLPAVISQGYWHDRWNGQDSVLSEIIRTQSGPHMTIVGVLDSDFEPVLPADVRLWTPLSVGASDSLRPGLLMGRATGDLTIDSAQAAIDAFNNDTGFGGFDSTFLGPQEIKFEVWPLHEFVVRDTVRQKVWLFATGVGIVLLIGILNVSGIQALRVSERVNDVAIQIALGSSRLRVISQIGLELVLIVSAGTLLAIILVLGAVQGVLRAWPAMLPRWDNIALDWRVAMFSVGVALLATLLVGLAPILRTRLSKHVGEVLQQGAPSITRERHEGTFHAVLILFETALAVVLVAGASLFLYDFAKLTSTDLGVDPVGVVSLDVALPDAYSEADIEFTMLRLLQRLRGTAGVESAAAADTLSVLPIGGTAIEGEGSDTQVSATVQRVSDDFGRAMGIPSLEGRWIASDDVRDRRNVAVVSKSVANGFWRDGSAVGRRIRVSGTTEWFRIVGVVEDVRSSRVRPGERVVYAPYGSGASVTGQVPVARSLELAVRADSRARGDALTELLQAEEPRSRITWRPLDERLSLDLTTERIRTGVMFGFAALGMLLAITGIYTVVAYSMVRRTREIGIRLALGATRGRVMWHVMWRGMLPGLVGLAIGLLSAWKMSSLLDNYLLTIDASQLSPYLAVLAVGAFVVFFACWIPGRQAANVEVARSIRYDA